MEQASKLDRVVRRKEAMQILGIRETKFREMMGAGELPEPLRTSGGRIHGWLESEIIAWFEARKAERKK